MNHFMHPIPIDVQLLTDDAKMPAKAHDNDMAYDICCVNDGISFNTEIYMGDNEGWNDFRYDGLALKPGQAKKFNTGIKVAAPEGWGFLLRDKSGLGCNNLIHVLGGVIEGTYRGEWIVCLINLGQKEKIFFPQDKIVQAVLTPVYPATVIQAKSLSTTDRGEKGFGSSGR